MCADGRCAIAHLLLNQLHLHECASFSPLSAQTLFGRIEIQSQDVAVLRGPTFAFGIEAAGTAITHWVSPWVVVQDRT
jgi:hypothetical protein